MCVSYKWQHNVVRQSWKGAAEVFFDLCDLYCHFCAISFSRKIKAFFLIIQQHFNVPLQLQPLYFSERQSLKVLTSEGLTVRVKRKAISQLYTLTFLSDNLWL